MYHSLYLEQAFHISESQFWTFIFLWRLIYLFLFTVFLKLVMCIYRYKWHIACVQCITKWNKSVACQWKVWILKVQVLGVHILQSLEVLACRLYVIVVLLFGVKLLFSIVYFLLWIFWAFLISSVLFYKYYVFHYSEFSVHLILNQ